MRLLVFGATGRTGRHLVALATREGLPVHAAGRDPVRLAGLGGGLGWSSVEMSDADAVQALTRSLSPDAVVSLIGGASGGGFIDEGGNIAISDAARAAGVRRIVQVSSLGCGDSRRYASEKLLAAIGTVLDAKTRAEDHLRSLDLDWTIVRPGGLTDGEATGGGALYEDPRVHGRISRADLAGLILTCLTAEDTAHKVLSAVDRATLSGPPDPHELAIAHHLLGASVKSCMGEVGSSCLLTSNKHSWLSTLRDRGCPKGARDHQESHQKHSAFQCRRLGDNPAIPLCSEATGSAHMVPSANT